MFVIWWGKRLDKSDLGYTSDYCPFCRTLVPCQVFRLTLVPHVYEIQTGPATLMGHSVRCQQCSLERAYRGESQLRTAPKVGEISKELEALAAQRCAKDLDLEQKRLQGTISAGERVFLIREPFDLLAHKAENAAVSLGSVNPKKMLYLLIGLPMIAIGLTFGFGIPHPNYSKEPHPLFFGIPIAAVGAFLLFRSIYLFIVSARDQVREEVLPLIVRGLTPLRPTVAELTEIIGEWKSKGHPIGRHLDPQQIERWTAQDSGKNASR